MRSKINKTDTKSRVEKPLSNFHPLTIYCFNFFREFYGRVYHSRSRELIKINYNTHFPSDIYSFIQLPRFLRKCGNFP